MLLENRNRFRKIGLTVMSKKMKKQFSIVMLITLFIMTGCSHMQKEHNEPETVKDIMETDHKVNIAEENSYSEEDMKTGENIAAVYQDIYEEAVEKNTLDSPEVIRSIVDRLGENGYSAIDIEKQLDMVCPERIRQFCGQVEAQKEAEISLIVVMSAIRFVKYNFTTRDGEVEVSYNYYLRQGDDWEIVSAKKYPAYTWVYSEEGYLFFEEYHMPGYDGVSGHTAFRVEPLDKMYRELGRKYLTTIGYDLNNLFTSDWNENDFQELHFYDLYVVLCEMKNVPYAPDGFFEEGITYEIPRAQFESAFQTFFRIDQEVLRQHTVYHEDTETYQYRARGTFDFAPTPYVPFPEVISYEENQDGTIKLTVNAVWPEKNTGKAFCHEVVIRPLEDGGFQYVSNHVIPSEDNVKFSWYRERLSEDKWNEYYGGR